MRAISGATVSSMLTPGPGPGNENNTDNRNVYTMRGQYLLTPSNAVSFLVIGDYSKRNESCCGAVQTADGPFYGIINALASVPELGGTPGATGIASPPLSLPSRQCLGQSACHAANPRHGSLGSARLGFGFRQAHLDYRVARQHPHCRQRCRLHRLDIVQEPANEGNMVDFKQTSEELRLAGKSGPLNWLVGGFFSSEILVSNTAIFAGNDFDLYLSGLVLGGSGTAELPPDHRTSPASRPAAYSFRAYPARPIGTTRPPRATRSSPTRPTTSRRDWI
jgi:iron complex outermembrane receptor protein